MEAIKYLYELDPEGVRAKESTFGNRAFHVMPSSVGVGGTR